MSFDVELLNFPDLTPTARDTAVATFRQVLERRLGGSEGVALHYAAYVKALEPSDLGLTKREAESAAAFMVALRMGERTAFENLKPPLTARFELHRIQAAEH